jgi:hypothetical protein
MAISGRAALLRQARKFLQHDCAGVVPSAQVRYLDAEPSDDLDDGRRNPEGKVKEIVVIELGGTWRMRLISPRATGPDGDIMVRNGQLDIEGPEVSYHGDLQPSSWGRGAVFLRENYNAG